MQEFTFALIHGAWHGPDCWDLVAEELNQLGHETVVVDLPSSGSDAGDLGSLDDDLGALRDACKQASFPLLLVGHSYGAAVASVAIPFLSGVRGLVSVAGLLPEEGESATTLILQGRTEELAEAVEVHPAGYLSINPEKAGAVFYGDCPDDVVESAVSSLRKQSAESVRAPAEASGWRTSPTFYVVCMEDHAIRSTFQYHHASERGAAMISIRSGHSPMLSCPVQLTEAILEMTQDISAV